MSNDDFRGGSRRHSAGSRDDIVQHANAQSRIDAGRLHFPVHGDPLCRVFGEENRGMRFGGLQNLRLDKALLDERAASSAVSPSTCTVPIKGTVMSPFSSTRNRPDRSGFSNMVSSMRSPAPILRGGAELAGGTAGLLSDSGDRVRRRSIQKISRTQMSSPCYSTFFFPHPRSHRRDRKTLGLADIRTNNVWRTCRNDRCRNSPGANRRR